MIQTCGGIVFVVGVLKSELFQKTARRVVFWIVSCEETGYLNFSKGVFDGCLGGFASVSSAPGIGSNMDPKFEYVFGQVVWPESTTPHICAGIQYEYGPVLNSVLFLETDFYCQSLHDLAFGQCAAGVEKPRHFSIAPET